MVINYVFVSVNCCCYWWIVIQKGDYYCMSMHVIYVQKGAVNIIIVVALLCMDMHHCVVSLKDACSLVQKEELLASSKLRGRGLMRLEGGTRF